MKIRLLLFLCFTTELMVSTFVDAAYPLNKDECIQTHNKYRKKHQAPDMKWSAKLASDAQTWANYLARNNIFKHDPSKTNQGENLYASSGDSQNSCERATTAFYNEIKYYDFNNPGFSKATGHFTQVVWVKSTELGVAKAERSNGGTVLVFRYSRPGNYLGQFAQNVKPVFTPVPSPTEPQLSSTTITPTSNYTETTGSAAGRHRTTLTSVLTFVVVFTFFQSLYFCNITQRYTPFQKAKMNDALLFLCWTAVIVTTVDAAFPLNKSECIEWHNKYRTKHQAPNITWSAQLASDAQKWADELAKNNTFEHDKNRGSQGENLYASSGDSQNSCERATTAFYNEIKDYDFDNPGFSADTGHFTQVVWVKSTQLGVGKAEKTNGGTVLVFRYTPPGNYRGQFSENVKPALGSASPLTAPPTNCFALAFGVALSVLTKALI
ncbi:uncharacterized protein LOC114515905 [Dendronephthya gigantea]|uniref:uncharacterized protein LOC114515905 n=1 Tax=Dendronephthya gigantea TaxID=151771 RepID=UPI00106A90E3|nr:uncharacterized protein LOC114515905 [Dendronephthya gigantea]